MAGPGSEGLGEGLAARVDGIAAWINELDTRLRATELATGDEKTARELRRAVEALSKHDPKLEKRLTNRVDVLADRLATLASTVSTTAASVARKDGEIASVRRDVEQGNRRLEDLVRQLGKGAGADEIEKLRAAIRAIQAERHARAGDARVDALSGKVDFLNERIDTLATTVGTTAAGLVGREGEIAVLRHRLDDGLARIEQTVAELRRLQGSETLADRLDTLHAAVDTTASGLTAREREIAAVRSRIDEAYSRVGTVVAELQGSIATLSAQVAVLETLPATTEAALDASTAELNERVDGLAERVESLATSVESALSGLVDSGAQVTALEANVGEAAARVDAVVAELREALDELPAPGALEAVVEERLAALAGSVDAAASRLIALEATSASQAEEARTRGNDLERVLADVGSRLDVVERDRDAAAEQLARVDEAWTEEREWVRGRLEELASAQAEASKTNEGFGPALLGLAGRLDSMERDHSAVSAEIARVSEALEAEHRSLHAELEALSAALAEATAPADDSALNELAARLESMEKSHEAVSAQIARFSDALEAERRSLHGELESLATALAEATAASGEDPADLLNALAARLDSVERDGAVVASEVARTTAFWASELEAIESKLDRVAVGREDAPGGDVGIAEPLLAELRERLESTERDRAALAAEIARFSGSWQVDRSSLEQRLDEVATRVAALGSEPPAAQAPSAGTEEIAQLRVAVDGLRMRLASSEQELATLVGSRDFAARLDDLSRRLESLERAPVVLAGPSVGAGDGGSLQGDGRFRLELRALELRMEHAEAAARENREAVLVQLERLAARIEWRFQRLEAEYEARQPQAVGGGGQVVPLRPAEV